MNNSIGEIIVGNLANLAQLVSAEANAHLEGVVLDIPFLSAIALILFLLTTRMVKRKNARFLGSSRRRRRLFGKNRGSDRVFEKQRSSSLKPCPNCAEQLPLSTIICAICDYNFLAERPGRGQALLPAPQPMTHELPDHIAS